MFVCAMVPQLSATHDNVIMLQRSGAAVQYTVQDTSEGLVLTELMFLL